VNHVTGDQFATSDFANLRDRARWDPYHKKLSEISDEAKNLIYSPIQYPSVSDDDGISQ
jgi:hypothetical protein